MMLLAGPHRVTRTHPSSAGKKLRWRVVVPVLVSPTWIITGGRGAHDFSTLNSAPDRGAHRQPRIPADLGFYDLRLSETRAAQAELAEDHGIEGFCYWHYWFGGKRLLERPFEEVLRSGEPDFPFCLAWANQRWTDTWLGT